LKKEIIIFFVVFLILSVGMHYKEFIEFPLEHIKGLPNSSAYGLGFSHPIIFTFIVYTMVSLPRLIFRVFKKA